MKVFVIPSWYPSTSNPIYGTFVREQLEMMSEADPSIDFVVSVWGQGDDPFLLYALQPLKSIKKAFTKHSSHKNTVKNNLVEYFSPAFTWSDKWRSGNIKGIISANIENLERCIQDGVSPEIVHVQASYPGVWIAREIKKRFGIPYVVTLRMSPFPFDQFLKKDQLSDELSLGLREASHLIATSNHLASIVRSFGLSHVSVVNNPVDSDFFSPVKANSAGGKRLLAVGRLEPQKGFDLLIESISQIDESVTLDVLGEGSERQVLEERIRELSLESRVRLFGQATRSTVRDHMQKADLFVLSSRHETFGNVLLESMACGKPVVATDCGGPADIVNEENGMLCLTNNAEELSRTIQLALEKPWDSGKIRRDVMKRFSAQVFTERMKKIYVKSL